MKQQINRVVLTIIIGFFLAFNASVFAETNQYDAAKLVELAQKSVARVIEAAQNDDSLQLEISRAKPFWEAVKQLNDSLGSARNALGKQDNSLFVELATAVASGQQAGIAVLMIPGVSDSVKEALDNTESILATIDENYSKEASRLAEGGELTPEEKKQLEELKAQQKALMGKLDEIEKTVAKNNEEMKKSINEIRENSNRILTSKNNHADFCHAMFAARFMSGMIWGWHHWWGPWGYWGPGFVNIHIVVWDDWTDYYAYDWALASDIVDAEDIASDLEDLDYIASVEDAELEEADQWLESADFSFEEEDLVELSSEMDVPGWDEVDTEIGQEVLEGYESNFDHSPFEQDYEMDVFDDMGGYDDFGGSFDF